MLQKRSFIIGFLVASLIFGTVASAAGASQITVYLRNLRYVINGQEFTPPSELEGFIYNNSTYVPLRFITESLGYNVSWDKETSTIDISGTGGVEAGATWLDSLKMVSTSGGFIHWGVRSTQLNDENTYEHGIEVTASHNSDRTVTMEYLLAEKYSRFKAVFGQTYATRYSSGTATISVFGDGELLFSKKLEENEVPINISTDIAGVSRLKLEIVPAQNNREYGVGLVKARVLQ